MKNKLSTKAETLNILKKNITKADVLPILKFSVVEYENNSEKIINHCLDFFNSTLIVRSSSSSEDNLEQSNAGFYESILDVELEKTAINAAIKKVINSYGEINEDDEILIQPMLKNVTMCGVAFSADLDTLAPYYIVNYDKSGSTSKVTNGETNQLETFISFKDNEKSKNKEMEQIIDAVAECAEIFDNDCLDVEFAYSNEKLYILQVRAIVKNNKNSLNSIDLKTPLNKLYRKIEKLNSPHPKLLGDRTIFGVMPDWNPAEIIGVKPKRLALSLYKELITDETWAYQRNNYGYRNLRSFPLLVSFLGTPYIDVRISFNSFIPKVLDDKIANKLINYYLEKLSENKKYHDKVEFKIIHSCYYFGISEKLEELQPLFNKDEISKIEKSLLEITNNVINVKDGLYIQDIKKIEILKQNYDDIVNSSLSIIDKIYWLIHDCKRYGTLPFAGVARAAFIAVQFLDSMVEQNIITQKESNLFFKSLNTISKQLSCDSRKLEKKELLDKYGHLRPGTYDITSLRYDEAYDEYFSGLTQTQDFVFNFTKEQKLKIDKMLSKNKLKINSDDFIKFLKDAIEGREYLKFVFSKSLSKVIKYIEILGSRYNLSRNELAYLDIQKILNLYATLDHRELGDILKQDILKNKEFYKYTKAIKLPNLITDKDDIYNFYLEEDEGNYITLKKIKAEIENDISQKNIKLKNKIVFIKSADPGYDYIFTKDIAGLITCYGGANSHMAIRCAELGIPAVIGIGEKDYNKYCESRIIEIDALNKQVKIIS